MGLGVGREKMHHSLSWRSHCPSLLFSEKSFFFFFFNTCMPHSLTHAHSLQEADKAFWSSIGHSASSKLSKILKSLTSPVFLSKGLCTCTDRWKRGLGCIKKHVCIWCIGERQREYDTDYCLSVLSKSFCFRPEWWCIGRVLEFQNTK